MEHDQAEHDLRCCDLAPHHKRRKYAATNRVYRERWGVRFAFHFSFSKEFLWCAIDSASTCILSYHQMADRQTESPLLSHLWAEMTIL